MQPADLREQSFQSYPPQARATTVKYLPLLQQLPLLLTVVLLREIIHFDTRFPREQRALQSQLDYLASLPTEKREALVNGFAGISLSSSLVAFDWVNSPQKFEEQLSAYLWATHQHDRFHAVSTAYVDAIQNALPTQPPSAPRWAAVVLNADLRNDTYPLFRKLRPQGVFFPRVESHSDSENGSSLILARLSERASRTASPFAHWYIDGGTPIPLKNNPENTLENNAISSFSWSGSAHLRETVLGKVHSVIGSNGSGPEMLSSTMAAWARENNLATAPDAPLQELLLSVYGDGSGTQIFSTTFVQWSSREILRRAEPASLVARYGARQQQRGMNEMFTEASSSYAHPDPAGSLIDADLGAYYTWINLNRLSGSESATFLAWSEAHHQAVAIGPGLPRGTESQEPISMAKLLQMIPA